MHDIKFIREHPEEFDKAMQKRGLSLQSSEILKLDEESRGKITRLQELQTKKNEVAKSVGQAKASGADVSALLEEGKQISDQLEKLQAETGEKSKITALLSTLPNIPVADVPEGKDESDNKEIRKWGNIREFDFKPAQHFDLGEQLEMMDFEQTAKISGSRFVTLSHDLAKLERALANFMLDMHTQKFGYIEVSPPFLVRDSAMYGAGQLPKFAEDSFATTNDYRLIPTSEVSLANMVCDSVINSEELPLRFTAYTPCFRSEAGSAGKDTRGMIRLHQFSKVELVSITSPEESPNEHERMTNIAEEVLKRLELPYRNMLLCSGDMGFSANKTYDLEVWLPGQGAYREISSVSNCGDFQARRMKARMKDLKTKKKQFVHTLNGSALAVGRTIVAVLENYQNKDGSVTIPDALREYMGGQSLIKAA